MAKKKNIFLTPEQEQAATSLGITNPNSQNDLNQIEKYLAKKPKQQQQDQSKNKKGDDQFDRLGITDPNNLTESQKLALTFDNIRQIATSGPQAGGGAGRDGTAFTPKMQALKSGSTYNKGLAVAQKQNPNQKFPDILPGLGRIVSIKESDKNKKAAPAPAKKKETAKPATPTPTPTPTETKPKPTPGPELKPSTVAEPTLQRGPSSVVRDKPADVRARLSIAQRTGRTKLGTNQLRIGSKSSMSGAKKAANRVDLANRNRVAFRSKSRNAVFTDTAGRGLRINADGAPRDAAAAAERPAAMPAAGRTALPATPVRAATPAAAATPTQATTPAAAPTQAAAPARAATPTTAAAPVAAKAATKPGAAKTPGKTAAPATAKTPTTATAKPGAGKTPAKTPATAAAKAATKPGAAVPAKTMTSTPKPVVPSPIKPVVTATPRPAATPGTSLPSKPAGTDISQIAPSGFFGYRDNAANIAAATKPLGIGTAAAKPVAATPTVGLGVKKKAAQAAASITGIAGGMIRR